LLPMFRRGGRLEWTPRLLCVRSEAVTGFTLLLIAPEPWRAVLVAD
jgi:hypothetical protein